MARAKKQKKNKPKSILTIVICSVVIICLLVPIILKLDGIVDKKKELDALQSTLESQVEENSALEEAVSQGDEAELMEEYARKKGYVMPDERVYVDITPGI